MCTFSIYLVFFLIQMTRILNIKLRLLLTFIFFLMSALRFLVKLVIGFAEYILVDFWYRLDRCDRRLLTNEWNKPPSLSWCWDVVLNGHLSVRFIFINDDGTFRWRVYMGRDHLVLLFLGWIQKVDLVRPFLRLSDDWILKYRLCFLFFHAMSQRSFGSRFFHVVQHLNAWVNVVRSGNLRWLLLFDAW